MNYFYGGIIELFLDLRNERLKFFFSLGLKFYVLWDFLSESSNPSPVGQNLFEKFEKIEVKKLDFELFVFAPLIDH